MQNDLKKLCESQTDLIQLSPTTINQVLVDLATQLQRESGSILQANQKDLDKMDINDPKHDRLKLTPDRIKDMSEGLKKIAKLKSPIGEFLEQKTLSNGLEVSRSRVPIGVIGMIYEARPNVTTDAFGIAFKTQNTIALKGGSDAQNTNQCVFKIIQSMLKTFNLNPHVVYLLPPNRSATKDLLEAVDYIDVIIPRGSQGLIQFVRDHAKVPVIETGAGIVHTYWDKSGRADYAQKIIRSAKTRRPSVCNALDTFIVHADNLVNLAEVIAPLAQNEVVIYADEASFKILDGNYPHLKTATNEHFGTEFLDYKMSLKTVDSLETALAHIKKHSSKHSESIITEDKNRADTFLKLVDAACVFHNTETGFSDGEQLELGAEIGISTQKLHARGPMALEAMTSYKWIIEGSGQTRI